MVGVVKSAFFSIPVCGVCDFHEFLNFEHDYGSDENGKGSNNGENGAKEVGACSLGLGYW